MSLLSGLFSAVFRPFFTPTALTPEIQRDVDEYIKESQVFLASKSWCPYSDKAKQLCQQFGLRPAVIELDQVEQGSEIQHYLQEQTGQRTVPFVFIRGKFIGGYSDLAELAESGKLQSLL